MPTSLIYIVLSTRGFTPWRPDAVISTPGGASNTCIMARAGIFKDPPQGTGLNVEDMLCETGFDRIAPTEAGFGACSSGASTLSPSKSIPGCRCFMLPVHKLRDRRILFPSGPFSEGPAYRKGIGLIFPNQDVDNEWQHK